jgi:hypothetical protein
MEEALKRSLSEILGTKRNLEDENIEKAMIES